MRDAIEAEQKKTSFPAALIANRRNACFPQIIFAE